MKNDIELELRAEISLNQFERLLSELNKKNRLLSHTSRLSVMFLGEINKLPFDISEYRVDIDPSMILKRNVETIAPNITRETVIMKWAKIAIMTYVNGKLAQLETPKGGSVNHVEKRFFFQPPEKIA